ncbi:MAG: hypothetical protein JSR60_02345 [Proteobacteria bacterium]|nr:hypothetical protein [Pseudomonadota bacterium]
MLCCSLFAVLLGQLGAWAGSLRFGGARLAAFAGWTRRHRGVLAGAFAAELILAAAALPALYGLDRAAQLGNWPICSFAAQLAGR